MAMKVNNPLTKSMTRASTILMLFTVLCVVILTGVNWLTAPYIELAKQNKEKQVFKDLFNLNDVELSNIEIDCRLISSLELLGSELPLPVKMFTNKGTNYYLVQAIAPDGYNGSIRIAVGMEIDKILGLRIIEHKETPGLGDKIELSKSDWVRQFEALVLTSSINWNVKKLGGQFDGFAGATITPQAVLRAVKSIAETQQLLTKLLLDSEVCAP
jgi:Na+-translocating ferredoxin:NAD+ oxidoreductase subunit G